MVWSEASEWPSDRFLSVVPVRAEPSDASEMVSQLLFGESFEILQQREKWIRSAVHTTATGLAVLEAVDVR